MHINVKLMHMTRLRSCKHKKTRLSISITLLCFVSLMMVVGLSSASQEQVENVWPQKFVVRSEIEYTKQ